MCRIALSSAALLLALPQGCCSPAAPAHALPPATAPAATRQVHQLSFRLAEPNDLQASLMTRPGKDRWPAATVKIYNNSGDEVIVGYEPGSVVVHCGEFEQRGPAITFVERREILTPKQPLAFELQPGGWMRSSGTAARDLMIPVELPPGKYPVWATFRLAGANDLVESPPDLYIVSP